MKRVSLIISLALVAAVSASAQSYFSFYQLREFVPQTQSLQPAFIQKNRFTAALPVANIGASFQSDFKLKDLLSKPNGSDELRIDFNTLLKAARPNVNRASLDATVHLLHFGLKTKKGTYSFFANSRASVDLQYGRELMEFLANGNVNYISKTMNISGTRAMANVYHEIGLGYTQKKFLDDRLTVGGRMKWVTGLFHGSLHENARGTITTDARDYSWVIDVKNGTFNTAGLDLLKKKNRSSLWNYLLNRNSTVAFDLGVKFKVMDWLEVEASINDLGVINWKERLKNHHIEDNSFTFSGLQLRGLENAGNAFQKELESKFKRTQTQTSFKTTLPVRTFISASAYLGKNNRFTAMASGRTVFGKTRFSYAGAYNRCLKHFTVGVVGSTENGSDFNMGANLTSDIGPVQLYLAMDNALVLNRPERFSKMDFRFGINLMFGYKKKVLKDKDKAKKTQPTIDE